MSAPQTAKGKDLLKEAMRQIKEDEALEAKVESMRKVMEGFVAKQLRQYFDANPEQYLQMQALITPRQRIERLEQEPDKGEEALRRIGLVKSHGEVTQQNLNHFVGLGFWARLKWLLFGPKRLLKTYPISDDAGNWGRGGLE